jgi:nitric oxide reductase large subunit
MDRRHVIRLLVVATAAAVSVQGALASGEPKNEPPFTRQVASRTVEVVKTKASIEIRGESKNERPFTRRVGR